MSGPSNYLLMAEVDRTPKSVTCSPSSHSHFITSTADGLLHDFSKRRHLARLQSPLRIELTRQLNEFGDQAGPSRLMAGAQTGAVVPVEIFEKEDVIPPMRIVLKFPGSAVDSPFTLLITKEDAAETVRNLLADFEEIHHLA